MGRGCLSVCEDGWRNTEDEVALLRSAVWQCCAGSAVGLRTNTVGQLSVALSRVCYRSGWLLCWLAGVLHLGC